MYKKLIIGSVIALSGFIAGALSRQPEINELKKQVRSLQAEAEKLHGVIEQQNNQIHELKVRYQALKGWQFVQKSQQRGYIRGSIMYQYALKEYLEMLIAADHTGEVNLNDSEVHFYNAFGTILNKGKITDKDRDIVINYISEKYKKEIDSFQEPDLSNIMEYIN